MYPMEEHSNLERHLIEMFTLAGEYCINIENAEDGNRENLYKFLSKIAPVLYVQGLVFPSTEEPEEGGSDRLVTEEQWENVFNSLRLIFGDEDLFYFIDHETGGTPDPVPGSLAEIFADVYQDLKDFAWLMSKNTTLARQHAAFDIKRLFTSNWGAKLLRAQVVLHSRLIDAKPDDEYADLFD